MPGEHRFKDEWIVRTAAGIPGVGPEKIEELRAKARPSLAAGLVSAGTLPLALLGEALKAAHGFGWLGEEHLEADKLAVSLVPEKVCRRHGLAPLRLRGEVLEIATASPLDIDALSDVQAVSGRTPAPLYCLPDRVESLINEFYRPEVLLGDLVGRLGERGSVEILEGGRDDASASDGGDAVQTPVVSLVNAVLSRAARMRASDIHIEHDEHSTHVRLRIDGLLRSVLTVPRHIGVGPIVSRIKIMSELDIAEHRRPQDGRAKIRVDGTELGLRVSVLPTNFGEKIVIRLLDPRAAAVPFEQLGFSPEVAARLDACCRLSQGIVLVTGPTGAGKTTTLYSVLNRLKSPDSNLVTVEDPIEYKLEGINQVQVRERIVAGDGESDLRRAALKSGALHTLRADALRRVQEGETTYAEILPYLAAEEPSAGATDAPVASAPPVAAPAKAAPAGGAPRLLLADDDKAIRLILRKACEAEGWKAEEAADGEQALEQAGEAPPDVLVLDLDMPKLDGYGVIKGLRQGLGLVDLPILILTASSDDQSQEQALTLGADDFVTKPFKPSLVTARLKAILRRRAAAAR